MNSNQLNVFMLVKETCNEYFGGFENTLDDCPKDSPEYKDAVKALTAPVEEICKTIEIWVRSSLKWERIENLHFVSLEWMRERIEKRVPKMQAETKENYPEIF